MIKSFASILIVFFLSCAEASMPLERATVQKIISPDTLEVLYFGKKERVRLIGVYIPKTGEEKAVDFLKQLLQGAKVYFEFERQRNDTDGATFVYMYIPIAGKSDIFVNSELLRNGLALTYTKYSKDFAYVKNPFRYVDEFRNIERKARLNKIGIWNTK